MLSVVVQPSVAAKLSARRPGELEEGEDQRAEHGERHRAGEDHEGVAERVELRGEHQEDEHDGEAHRGQELARLLAELARLARVVDARAGGQDLLGLLLEHLEARVERPRGDARDLDRVELLEAVQGARLDAFLDGRDRAERDELPVRAGDVDLAELRRGQARRALDLRDHLVAAAVDAEAIDEVAAEHRREIRRDVLHREAHGAATLSRSMMISLLA